VAANVLKRGRDAPDVVLIERGKRFGPGLAYGTREPAHLLNVRSSNMSLYADQRDHFARWIKQADRFAPRAKYGAYVEATLNRAGAGFGGPHLLRVHDEAMALTPSDGGWTISLASQKTIEADAVVLALGNAASGTLPRFAQAGVAMADPWAPQALAQLPRGDLLLMGSGLTAIDAALSLAKRRKKGTIYVLSRRGLTPRSHFDSPTRASAAGVDLPLQLSEALHTLRREVDAMKRRGEPWQYVMERIRARTPELWRRLSPEQRARFLRHLRPWWDVHRHRCAPEIAARVKALIDAGRLRVLAGDVVSVAREGAAIQVMHRQRGSYVRHRLEVAGVVNCIGPSLDPRASDAALVRQLVSDGLVRAHETGLGFDVDPDCRLIDASGAAHAGLYALGPITLGAFWECMAVPEIRVRAAAIAMMLAPER
jgi:uncharacterized NAD(P)/FAD-binding protein YdhS